MMPFTGPGSGAPTVHEVAAITVQLFEGLRTTAYQDPGRVWTIGFGHTGPVDSQPIAVGMQITRDKAIQLFAEDIAPLYALVKDRPLLEAAMLISFGYNCGIGTLQKLLAGHTTIMDPIHQTDRLGHVLPFLATRRIFEETMILVSQFMTPSPHT